MTSLLSSNAISSTSASSTLLVRICPMSSLTWLTMNHMQVNDTLMVSKSILCGSCLLFMKILLNVMQMMETPPGKKEFDDMTLQMTRHVL